MVTKVCKILSMIILIVLALVAVLLVGPPLVGFQALAVVSGSMEPAIPVGSIVYVKDTAPEDIQVGDVITFRLSSDVMATHRVVEKLDQTKEFVTKGDANDSADGPVSYDKLVGKVSAQLPYAGIITAQIKSRQGIVMAAALLIVLVIITFLPEIFKKEEPGKSDKKSQADSNDQ